MCGIAGFLSKNFVLKEEFSRMVHTLNKRGPDDFGIWNAPNSKITLGHTRLSILDLSQMGHQPMHDKTNRFTITYNGEIYNYQEIKSKLENLGYTFKSTTDTEVILSAWTEWGVDSINLFRGMFAFGIWDDYKKQLFLVRDRLGIKPLLWAQVKNGFVFSSQLNSILESNLIERKMSKDSLFDFLAQGSVCQPRTIIEDVFSLSPGTYMIIDEHLNFETKCYWNISSNIDTIKKEISGITFKEGAKIVRNSLEESCQLHMLSDVNVGSFLSGGVDSTSITAIMARLSSSRIMSFSIGFENNRSTINELDAARMSAYHIGTLHSEIIINNIDVKENFNDFIKAIDQPTIDGANTYFVCKAASNEIKVALSGLGGDEFFAGYPHFNYLNESERKIPSWLNSFLVLVEKIRPNKYTRSAIIRNLDITNRYSNLRRFLHDDDIYISLQQSLKVHFTPQFLESYIDPFIDRTKDSIYQTSIIESKNYLLNTLLRDSDALGMHYSMEIRPVMLDHNFIELALALPSNFKVRNREQKAILKEAVRDLLPEGHLKRPKTGFELPLGYWANNVLKDQLNEALTSSIAKEIFSNEFLNECRLRSIKNESDNFNWNLLVLISWLREKKVHL